jgi:hypothetical protein
MDAGVSGVDEGGWRDVLWAGRAGAAVLRFSHDLQGSGRASPAFYR